jgi:site-specific DNA recombinase
MDKVAIYVRVSTADKQDFQRQVSDLQKHIYSEGYTDEQIEIYSEKLSGYDQTRPELNKLLEIALNNPKLYKCIYVTEISRIGRNPKHTREVIDSLTEKKIPLYIQTIKQCTIDDSGNRNIIVSIILQVLMEFADLEANTMKTRIKSGKRQRVKEGKFSTPNNPYGYTADENGYVIIDEKESEIVKMIYEKYEEGIGALVIAKTLNEMKIPTKFNTTRPNKIQKYYGENIMLAGSDIIWSDTAIFQILKNTIYYGKRKYKVSDEVSEIIDGKKIIIKQKEYDYVDCPAIITKEQFDKCTEIRTQKIDRQYFTKYEYILKDIMRCGVCGRKYLGKYHVTNFNVYYCTSKISKEGFCGNNSINISLLESVIYHLLLNSGDFLKELDDPNNIINNIKIELKNLTQLLKNEKKELTTKENQLTNLINAISKSSNPNFEHFGKLENELQNSIKQINDKISSIQKEIFSKKTTVSNFNQQTANKELLINSKDNRPLLTSLFKQFVKKIIITNINKDYILANVFIEIKGIKLGSLKLFIYARGVRSFGGQKEKIYKYLPMVKMLNEPVYNENNILISDKNELVEEFESMKHYIDNDTINFYPHKFIFIPKENILNINKDINK